MDMVPLVNATCQRRGAASHHLVPVRRQALEAFEAQFKGSTLRAQDFEVPAVMSAFYALLVSVHFKTAAALLRHFNKCCCAAETHVMDSEEHPCQ